MQRDFLFVNRNFKDLNPMLYGCQDCAPGHSFGPSVRTYTIIHYVERGKGTLYKYGREYPVRAGEAFVILPHEVTTYTADTDDPWTYRWIGFDGDLSLEVSKLSPVIKVANNAFPHLTPEDADEPEMISYRLAAQLFAFYGEIFSGNKHGNHYVRKVIDYINSSYMREVRVEEIADSLSLDRRYLSRLFKQRTGMTIQEYLINVRMEAACRQLSAGGSVTDASVLCGYSDVCNFSKMFKRMYGVSPKNWRNREKMRENRCNDRNEMV